MADPVKIVTVPQSPFVFGDARFRVLYGPENDTGERPVAGVIREDLVSALETILEQSE